MRNGVPSDNVRTDGPARSGRRTLSRDDWARAALEAMRESGLGAIAVEPLAERLGTTKGSFYWHFKDRDALIHAALELWCTETDAMMEAAARITDPVERGRWLTEFAFTGPQGADVTTTLLVNSQHPVVGPFLDRVTRQRLEWGAGINEELGLAPEEARQHALAAWMMAIGIALVRRGAPQLLPQGDEADAFKRFVMELMRPLR
ncbi:TetR/AcrR family transcriptional regulator [Yinghuangia aomiensis]|uniref:TetR/AcrR family transcriptional regulator n=1 Tax=Yinghuangia aomiensis TaxID=676205 RepID=A0ABP9I241_9ACTN